VDIIICIGEVSRHLERKCHGGVRSRRNRIRICGRIFDEFKGGKTIEEFMQEFKRAARGSGYEERPLIEEFKRRMNGGIRRKLMEAENQPASIEQWYKRATALDRNWRKSRQEEERLRGKKEMGGGQKQEQKMILP